MKDFFVFNVLLVSILRNVQCFFFYPCCLFQHLLAMKHLSTLAEATETILGELLLFQCDKHKHVTRQQPCKSLQLKLQTHTHTHTYKKVHNKKSKSFVIDVGTGAITWWSVEQHFLWGRR